MRFLVIALYLRFLAFKISVSSNETDSLEEQFVIIKGRESSSTGRRGKLRESTKGKKKGAALISHLDVIPWLSDHRLTTDNWTIITSRSLSLVLMRIFAPSPPYDFPPLSFSRYRIVRSFHLYFGVLATLCWQESFHGYAILWERNQSDFCSLHLSLAWSLSVSLHLALFPSTWLSVSVRPISFPLTQPRRLVRWSAAIMTPRGGEYAPRQDRLHSWLYSSLGSHDDRRFVRAKN